MARTTCHVCNGAGIVGDMSLKKQCHKCYGRGWLEGPDQPAHADRVICTELYKQHLMSRADYHRDVQFSRTHLTDQHVRGYHFWATHVVRKMRRSKRSTQLWRRLAQARANQIAYVMGVRPNPDMLGWALRAVGEPICWLIGAFVSKQNWQSLYSEG